jgi:hypothetical protein
LSCTILMQVHYPSQKDIYATGEKGFNSFVRRIV